MKSGLRIGIRPCTPFDLFFVYNSYLEKCGKYYRDNTKISCFIGRPKSKFDALTFVIKNFRSIKSPDILMYIVTINGKNGGFWIARVNKENRKKLSGGTICICEKYQGKGIGKRLIRPELEALGARGAKIVMAEVHYQNAQAIPFYYKHGFRLSGCLQDYFGINHDAIILKLVL